jgi:ubiquinone/menaquinone biosynthesis C-methylase UbiE
MSDLQDRVRDWWNTNPFSYGLSQKGAYRDVGNVSDEDIHEEFFNNYLRKVRKHLYDAQSPGEPLAARFIPYESLKDRKVLDIACGMGWSTIEMARAGVQVTGIDISTRVIEIARKHIALRNLEAKAEALVMDAQALQFEDESFDFVHAYGCLMHMPDTEKAISEIYRVLRPGGETFGYMYNKNSPTYWWHFWFLRGILLGRLIKYKGDTQRLVSRYTDGNAIGGNPHTKVYTPKQAKGLFADTGFEEVSVQPWGPPNLLDSFPIQQVPLGKYLLTYPMKKAISDRIGFGMMYKALKPRSKT